MASCELVLGCGFMVQRRRLCLNGLSTAHGEAQRCRRARICRGGLQLGDGAWSDESLPSYFVKGKRLSELSTWGIGGLAKYFVEVYDESQLSTTLRFCQMHGIPHFIVGKGSNCLFDDRGFEGCIILNCLKFAESDGNGIYRVGSGYSFNVLGIQSSKDGFTGLEFAAGIPGTVGGAVYMNASANGQETADVIKSVEILTADGERIVHSKKDIRMGYSYRLSPYQRMPGFVAILAATFELKPCLESRERYKRFLERRRSTQPITEKSAGCVFRNPGAGIQSAGALIEKAGLKGVTLGQAKVSDTHANFLLNSGGSSAAEMLNLITLVKEEVKRNLGVDLREEIIYVPYR